MRFFASFQDQENDYLLFQIFANAVRFKIDPSESGQDAAKTISTLDKELLETIGGGNGGGSAGKKTISVGKKKITVTDLGNFSPPPSAFYYDRQ